MTSRSLSIQQAETELNALKAIEEKIITVATAQDLVQRVAEAVQTSAHRQIASVVTRCLQSVFGEQAYEFGIIFDRKRSRTEAKLVFRRNGVELNDPLNEAGGGVIAVAAFALRLACIVLSHPRRRRLIVADEPFSQLSRQYLPQLRQLLQALAEEMNFQMIFVSHLKGLRIGKVVRLGESS